MAQMNEQRSNPATQSERGRTDSSRSVPVERERSESRDRGLARRGMPGSLGWSFRDPFSLMNTLFGNLGLSDLDRGWTPQVESYEKDGKLVVRADLPGLSKDDVHIDVRDNILTIEGERKQEKLDEKSGWSERSYSHFYRALSLPEGVNPETAKASFRNGVLEIALDAPRRDVGGKRIEISE